MNCHLENRNKSLDQCYADKPHARQRLLEISDMIDALAATALVIVPRTIRIGCMPNRNCCCTIRWPRF